MALIIGFIIIFIGYLLSIVYEMKHQKILSQGIDIEEFDGYVKLSDIKSYIKENDYDELLKSDKVELLKYGEMIEIEVTVFAKERMIDSDDLEYLLKDEWIYRDGYLLNKAQDKMAEKYSDMSRLVSHLFLAIGVSTALIMCSFNL